METVSKDELHLTQKALEICMAKGIDPIRDMPEALHFSKTALLYAVRKKAPRGQKTAEAEEVVTALKAVEAIKTATYDKMVCKPAKEEKGNA
jgi:hypothetical protein